MLEGLRGGVRDRHSVVDQRNRVLDQLCGLARGLRALSCQIPHFVRDNGEALARRPGPCRFHGGVQRQNIGLESNVLDRFDDLPDFR